MTVSEVCDWYLEQAEAGRILGRNRRPIKTSTLHMDRSRIESHIKPLLGSRLVSGLTLHDIEGMQADIAAGKSAPVANEGRRGPPPAGGGRAGPPNSHLRPLPRPLERRTNPCPGGICDGLCRVSAGSRGFALRLSG